MKRIYFFFILFLFSSCIKDESSSTFTDQLNEDNTGDTITDPPSDPFYDSSWHIENTGQKNFATNAATPGEDSKIFKVHEMGYFGEGIRIAISDGGVQVDHPDLGDNQLIKEHRNYSFNEPTQWTDPNSNPIPSDGDGHGTSVAGLISAVGWNNLGSRGVAPKSKFAGFYFITSLSESETIESFYNRLFSQMDGDFDIFNYSYGSSGCEFVGEIELESDALLAGVEKLRDKLGAIYVQSSGNSFVFSESLCSNRYDNTNRDPSKAIPYKILAGALNANGTKASYSSPGSGLWVSAAGGEDGVVNPALFSTDVSGCQFGLSQMIAGSTLFNDGYHPLNLGCDFTNKMNGTSGAAPIVSGIIALILEANPKLSWRDIKHILALTADEVDSEGSNILNHPGGEILSNYTYDVKWTTNEAGFHFSNWYGFGRINALAAVNLAKDYDFPLGPYNRTEDPNTNKWYYSSGEINLAIPDANSSGVSSQISVLHNFLIEAVQIRLTTTHTKPGNLAVHLVSPSGTESRLLNINSNFTNTSLDEDFLLLSNAFYGEESLGNWTLKIVDGKSSNTGFLKNWKMNIHGSPKRASGLIPNSPKNFIYNANTSLLSKTPVFNFTHSTSPDIIRYEIAIGDTPQGQQIKKWYSIGYTNNFQINKLSLKRNNRYYLHIKAIDKNEISSLITTLDWMTNSL
jgi:subtilisin-like proprotein convertase family protein